MKILIYICIFISVVIVLLSVILDYKSKVDSKDCNIQSLPKIIGWIGVGDILVCSAISIMCLLTTDDSDVSAYLFPCAIFYLFILLGMYLSLITFNKRFEIKQDVVIYTNCFRRKKIYAYNDFTKIRQNFGGDYVCYVKGKRAFAINEEFILPLIFMKNYLPKDIEYDTKESRQDAKVKDGIITSKTNWGGYLIAWMNFLMPLGGVIVLKMNDGLYSFLAFIWLLFGIGYLIYVYRYLVIFDKHKSILKIRHFFRTSEYCINGLKWEEKTNNGIPIAIKFYKNKKKVCNVDVSATVTNRDILIKALKK